MAARVLLVTHSEGHRDDRASRILMKRGVTVEWTFPGKGGKLPPPNGSIDAAIVYGGVESANSGAENPHISAEIDWIGDWVGAGKPYLGICLGGQLLARSLGAGVAPHPDGVHECGFVQVTPTAQGRAVLPEAAFLYQYHGEGFEVPAGAELLMTGGTFPNQAFRHGNNAYGFQFHPEVTPAVMTRWLDSNPDHMNKLGVHSRQRQMDDSSRYDPPMAAWFEGFLESWIGGGW